MCCFIQRYFKCTFLIMAVIFMSLSQVSLSETNAKGSEIEQKNAANVQAQKNKPSDLENDSSEALTQDTDQFGQPVTAANEKASQAQVKTRNQLIKFSLTLLGLTVLMYVLFNMLRKTSMFKHLSDNPLKIKSVIGITGKSRVALIEVNGVNLLLGVTDQNVNFLKEFHAEEKSLVVDADKALSSENKPSPEMKVTAAQKNSETMTES